MSTRKTKWKSTSVHQFPLKDLEKPAEIMDIMKQLSIKKYTYEIRCNNITIKFGMSDATTTQDGERIYRQIGHLDSWGENKLSGDNGIEFLDYNKEYKSRYGKDMDHNEIIICVWNFDFYPFETIDTTSEIESAEIELIENYKNIYGGKPIGNIDDTHKFHRKSAPVKNIVNGLFPGLIS
jgi:hypothetical protein